MFTTFPKIFKSLPPNLRWFIMGSFIQGIGLSVYNLLFNLYLKEAGLKEGLIGSLASTASLGTAIVAFPAAFILESFSVKPMVIFGISIAMVFYILQIQVDSLDLFYSFGLIGGMGVAIFNISVAPFVFRNTQKHNRMLVFSLNSASMMFAHLLGFLMGGELPVFLRHSGLIPNVLASYKGAMSGALCLLVFSLYFYSKIKRVPVPKVKQSFKDHIGQKDWKTISRLMLPKVFLAFGAGLIVPFMNMYLKDRFHLNTEQIGLSFACLQFFIFAGIFIAPHFLRRFSTLTFIVVTAAISIPFMLSMAFATNVAFVLGCFFIRGMLMNMSAPVISLFEMERVRESECLFASSMIIFCYNLTWTFSTQVGGHLIEKYSYQMTFIAASGFYLLVIATYSLLFKEKKMMNQNTLPEHTQPPFSEAA